MAFHSSGTNFGAWQYVVTVAVGVVGAGWQAAPSKAATGMAARARRRTGVSCSLGSDHRRCRRFGVDDRGVAIRRQVGDRAGPLDGPVALGHLQRPAHRKAEAALDGLLTRLASGTTAVIAARPLQGVTTASAIIT